MYLAKHVCGWSTTKIGRFYNGRHHSTVLHAIGKVESLRRTDGSIDAVVEVLIGALSPRVAETSAERFEPKWTAVMMEAITARVLDHLGDLGSEKVHSLQRGTFGRFASREAQVDLAPQVHDTRRMFDV